ncbi:MAG: S-methyl-5'-thioinosine phosphorylase [Candidatus Hodarchaeota archaeon]
MEKGVKTAIIGGSGLYTILEEPKREVLETPFGSTPQIEIGIIDGVEAAFLPRHAEPGRKESGHHVPPHLVNYRANIYGLRMLGVERIIASNTCGAINVDIKPASFVVLDQFIDMTKGRKGTFYDGKTPIKVWRDKQPINKVVHVDVTQPFCTELRKALIHACRKTEVFHFSKGTYICTGGPRFETPAEIKAFRVLGADVVGMTLVPESVLARELSMCYASLGLVTNWAAGISKTKVTLKEVLENSKENIEKVREVFKRTVRAVPEMRKCDCRNTLNEVS